MSRSRGRKPSLSGRLARQGAQSLKAGRLALDAVAEPPEHFGAHACDMYELIVTELAEMNVLARSDVSLIEMAARAYERWVVMDAQIIAVGEEEAAAAIEKRLDGGAEVDRSHLSDAVVVCAGELGNKGFMSGLAQARAAAAKEHRVAMAELGLTQAARLKSAGAGQHNFFDKLDGGTPADDDDPYAPNRPDLKVVG